MKCNWMSDNLISLGPLRKTHTKLIEYKLSRGTREQDSKERYRTIAGRDQQGAEVTLPGPVWRGVDVDLRQNAACTFWREFIAGIPTTDADFTAEGSVKLTVSEFEAAMKLL